MAHINNFDPRVAGTRGVMAALQAPDNVGHAYAMMRGFGGPAMAHPQHHANLGPAAGFRGGAGSYFPPNSDSVRFHDSHAMLPQRISGLVEILLEFSKCAFINNTQRNYDALYWKIGDRWLLASAC